MIWDWNKNPEFEINRDFIQEAYNHAKANFPLQIKEYFLPPVDTLVENFTGAFTKKMDLTEHFVMMKAEVSELQKFLVNLGFNQPIIFEFCRIKVKLTITVGYIEDIMGISF